MSIRLKNKKALLEKIYRRLFKAFGPQHWWPGDSPLEVAIGAVLTQNTAWSNVELAIKNLKRERLICLKKLGRITPKKLAELIRPAGYFNVKADRLKNLFRYLNDKKCNQRLSSLARTDTARLRDELLAVKGVGPETADSILLYALNRPIFVVDAYTKRFLLRHRLVAPTVKYDELQRLFMNNLKKSSFLFNEFHALIVHLGKTHCKTRPDCSRCPLRGI